MEGASEEAVGLLFFRIPLRGLCELVEVAMPGGEGPLSRDVLAVAAVAPPGCWVEGASGEAVGLLFFRMPLTGLCELVEVAMPGGEGPLSLDVLAVAAVAPPGCWVEEASKEAVELLFFRIPLTGLCELVEVAMPGRFRAMFWLSQPPTALPVRTTAPTPRRLSLALRHKGRLGPCHGPRAPPAPACHCLAAHSDVCLSFFSQVV